jgi:predicted porin
MKTPQRASAMANKASPKFCLKFRVNFCLNFCLVLGGTFWGLPPLAKAESQIYGTMDLALNGVSHQGAVVGLSKATAHDVGLLSGGLSPSRLGFKGQELWGGGWSAVFTLESGFNAANGKAPNGRITVSDPPSAPFDGKLFAREANVGLKNAIWGEVRLGLQANPMAMALSQFDVNSGFMDPLAFNGGYAGGGFTSESRWENSVNYTLAPHQRLKASVMYRLPDTGTVRQAYAGAVYLDLSPVRLALIGGRDTDAQLPPMGSFAGFLTVQFANTKTLGGVASWDATPALTLKGGWERIMALAPSPGHFAIDESMNGLSGGAALGNNNFDDTLPRNENMAWIGAGYLLKPSLTLNGGFYERTTRLNGPTGSHFDASMAKYYVGEIIERLSKRTDVYFNATFWHLAGPAWSNAYPNHLSLGVGMRHSF